MWMFSSVSRLPMTDWTASVLEVFFDCEPAAIEHVEEIGVSAGVQLVGALDFHAALAEEIDNRAMENRRAELRLDVVADRAEVFFPRSASPTLGRWR